MSELLRISANVSQMLPGAFFQVHREEVAAAMLRVLDSGWYILGSEVKAFEKEFGEFFGFGGAVGVASGTDALVLALRALGVGPGDRVATVSHTAVATVAAIELAGASAVLVDISPDTFTMDPASLERAMQAYGPIKAVIPVHLYGHPAEIVEIVRIARDHGSLVVEDCSQAHGTKFEGRFAGDFGDIATFSFYPTKNLGALGDGGMVVSHNPACIERVRSLREYGWERRYISEVPGMNSRLDEVQAAVLRVRLRHLEAGNRSRAEIAAAYDRGLRNTSLVLPNLKEGATHTYHQYVVRSPERDTLQRRMKEIGVGTNIHYPVPVHLQPAYTGRCLVSPGGLFATEVAAREILSLPMYPELDDAAVASTIDAVCASV